MAYNNDRLHTNLYADVYSQVNTVGDYNTLGNYYQQMSCPPNSTPGTCNVQPITVSPVFGGVGFSIPGFNSNFNNAIPLSDSNYFNLNTAYPQSCKQSLTTSSTYSQN